MLNWKYKGGWDPSNWIKIKNIQWSLLESLCMNCFNLTTIFNRNSKALLHSWHSTEIHFKGLSKQLSGQSLNVWGTSALWAFGVGWLRSHQDCLFFWSTHGSSFVWCSSADILSHVWLCGLVDSARMAAGKRKLPLLWCSGLLVGQVSALLLSLTEPRNWQTVADCSWTW